MWHSRTRVGRAAWRVLTAVLALAVLGLVVFHGWLFWDQLLSGRLLDPQVALRWTLGGLLGGSVLWLRRLSVPLLHGRKALTFWLLVTLLHCWSANAPGSSLDAPLGAHLPDVTALYVLPVTAGPLVVGLGLLLLASLVRRQSAPALRGHLVSVRAVTPRWRLDSGPPLPGRAPPVLFA